MSQWKLAWSYVPIDGNCSMGTLQNMTQRATLRNNLCGSQIKIKFMNLYHTEPMHLAHVTVAKKNRTSGSISDWKTVTCQDEQKITIAPGANFYSDAVECIITPEEDFVISIYFKEPTDVRTYCQTWCAQSWQSALGPDDQTESAFFSETDVYEVYPSAPRNMYKNQILTGFCNIAVYTEEDVKTLALFGDSITHMSFYSDPLMESLYQQHPGTLTILNGGISGNRIAADAPYLEPMPGQGKSMGEAGCVRLARDMYADTTPDILFLMEGVNDCTHSFAFDEKRLPTGQSLWNALKQAVDFAHSKGTTVYMTTVMPFGCYDMPWREEAEAIRQDLNRLLRAEHPADDIIDLDEIMRNPEDIHFMKDGMHMGDGVHPSQEGGKVIANALLNKWFRT